MAQSDAHNGRSFGSKYVKTFQGAVPSQLSTSAEQRLPMGSAVEFVLGTPGGSVLALGGIDGESLRVLIDRVEPERCGRRALFARITPAPTAEAIVEQIIDLFADTARRLWPIWFTDVSFAGCRNDDLGRLAAGVIARGAAERPVCGSGEIRRFDTGSQLWAAPLGGLLITFVMGLAQPHRTRLFPAT